METNAVRCSCPTHINDHNFMNAGISHRIYVNISWKRPSLSSMIQKLYQPPLKFLLHNGMLHIVAFLCFKTDIQQNYKQPF